MSAVEDALRCKCPDCGASSGSPCLYMMPKSIGEYVYSHRQQELVARVGKPTTRPHNGRLYAAHEARSKRQRAEWAREWAEKNKDQFADERRAYADAFNAEQRQLKTWLQMNGSVLWQ